MDSLFLPFLVLGWFLNRFLIEFCVVLGVKIIKKKIGELSSAELKLVQFARAIIGRPRILLLNNFFIEIESDMQKKINYLPRIRNSKKKFSSNVQRIFAQNTQMYNEFLPKNTKMYNEFFSRWNVQHTVCILNDMYARTCPSLEFTFLEYSPFGSSNPLTNLNFSGNMDLP